MPTVNLRRFSEPDTLREIAPAHLLALLEPHREFLAGRGLTLPPAGSTDEPDYETLASMFLSPDDIPQGLVEKFHLVKQMSSHDAMDTILDTVREREVPIDFAPDSSPMDIAAQLLVKHRDLFHELHADKSVARYRGFTYFVGEKIENFEMPANFKKLEATLNDWYELHQRGRTAKVMYRQKDSKFWIYVRHAEPIKREGCVGMTDNRSGSMIYRPERHDLVIFDPSAGELGVHADCKDEPELFRQAFGLHLCGDRDFFPHSRRKYTLEPLKVNGPASLDCSGIQGMKTIKLKELEYETPGEIWARRRIQAADVFKVLENDGDSIPEDAELRQAKFAVKFHDAKRARTIIVRPSNYAQVGRDDDAVIMDEFFRRQGFVLQQEEAPVNGHEVLAHA
jgi:hypothetical protein